MYGLDMSQVRYEVDDQGNRKRAIIPLSMFDALMMFWVEARRRETRQMEARTPRGLYRSPLGGVVQDTHEPEAAPPVEDGRFGRKWADLMACMPEESEPTPEAANEPRVAAVLPVREVSRMRTQSDQFAPDDTQYPRVVLDHMIAGKSPLTAWRLHRDLSLGELAERYCGRTGNMKQLEESRTLRPRTIAKLCPILHCKPEQLLRPASLDASNNPARKRA